jgi:hypothetical protein
MVRVRYDAAIITYLDVLGFKQLIQTKTAGQISRIIRILQEATRPAPRVRKSEQIGYVNFSDTTIRILPTPDEDDVLNQLFWEILNLVHIQATLTNQGILVRGAVSIGPIVKSWRVVYGPGLVRSYELEQQASFPRIILDPDWFDEADSTDGNLVLSEEDDEREVKDMLIADTDGYRFIDYLKVAETEIQNYPRYLKNHAELIAEGLVRHRHDRNVLSKFKWLQRYHNRVVRKRYGRKLDRELLA